MPPTDSLLAAPTEVGSLGIYQLKRLWSRSSAARRGRRPEGPSESQIDSLVIHAVGLGLEPTLQYLFRQGPSFEDFEAWIVAKAGSIDPDRVARINAAVVGGECPPATCRQLDAVAAAAPVLSAEDLAHWDREGYVIVPDAVSPEACVATAQAIWDHVGAEPDAPDTWYFENTHGIMVQLFQHPALTSNRQSARIHKAFAQLWGTEDLWMTTDRVGFNAPERPDHPFKGPHLHWDVSLQTPIPFGTQGILYLTDTPAEQGAFTCVPGFHKKIEAWLKDFPPGAEPRQADLYALGAKPIAGRAGDLVIWHQALPHGSSPNRGQRPRLVHYMNMHPAKMDEAAVWK